MTKIAVTIECRPNGPYLVKGLDELSRSSGEALRTEPVVALCRCGGSATKPFCDGTHKKNGFSDARVGGGEPDRADVYQAPGITLRDNRSICAHAGHCTDGLATVFKYGSEPWIDAAGATPQAIAAVVARCPSGALSCTLDGQSSPAAEPGPGRVTVEKDGPYAVRGPVALVNAPWASGAAKDRYTLCRCGQSKNKPFCDGTHWDAGFKD